MGLIQTLKTNDKKRLFSSDDHFINYSTGILPLDYANGFWQEIYEKDGSVRSVPITGIMGGTFVSIIGNTGTGKTTLADQIGYGIIKNFDDGVMYHIDAERTSLKQRIIRVTGADIDDERIILKKENIAIEDVLEMIDKICKTKEEGKDLYKYEVKDKSFNGKPFKVYVPTVFIIDSLPSFNSKAYVTEDLGTNMDPARASRDISRFYNNCLDNMQKYNITIITINHIRPKVDANPYSAPPKGLFMLKSGETLTRGYAPQFWSQNYFRINTIPSNIYSKADVGFDGFKGSIQLAKTKTNFIGATIDVAFNKDIGFDPIFSLYEFSNSIGLLQGRNPHLYFQGLDTFKFSRKDFRKKFLDERPFREAVIDTLLPHLEGLLGLKILTIEDKVRYGDLMRAEEERAKVEML